MVISENKTKNWYWPTWELKAYFVYIDCKRNNSRPITESSCSRSLGYRTRFIPEKKEISSHCTRPVPTPIHNKPLKCTITYQIPNNQNLEKKIAIEIWWTKGARVRLWILHYSETPQYIEFSTTYKNVLFSHFYSTKIYKGYL